MLTLCVWTLWNTTKVRSLLLRKVSFIFKAVVWGLPTQGWNHQTKVNDVIQDSLRPQSTSLTHFSKSRSVWKCPRCCLNFLLEVNFNHRCEKDWGSNIQRNGYSWKGREEGEKVKNNTGILESRAPRAAHKIEQRASRTLSFEAEYPRKAWLSCLFLVIWAKTFSDRNETETQALTSQLYFLQSLAQDI